MPSFNLDVNSLKYLMLVVLLATIAMSLKRSGRIILKSILKIVIAAGFIYIFNYIGGNIFNITIPFNPLTVLIAGLLELPGVALIFIMKYVIYP